MTSVQMPNGSILSGPPRVMRRILVSGARVLDPQPRSPEKVPTDRKVRVLVVVHGWFPYLAAGSERMMQHLISALPSEDYHVEVLSFGFGEPEATSETEYEYEGIKVNRGFEPPFAPDLVILHHEFAARWVHSLVEEYPGINVVTVHHNERYGIPDLRAVNSDLNVFNTAWVKAALKMPGIVVHPPLELERHRVDSIGSKVTMVNLSPDKGVDTFLQIARACPEIEFLGVEGSHGPQWLDRGFYGIPDNVEIRPVTQDMRTVWADSRVVLMPSVYESWGMVATEAASNGIPVVCTPTPGLKENLGDAGLYVEHGDLKGYIETVKSLMTDEDFFNSQSQKIRDRGLALGIQTQRELQKFHTRVERLVR